MAKPLSAACMVWMFVACLPGRAQAHSLELGGGVHVPLDGDDRSSFGAAPAFSMAYAAPLKPGTTWFFLEVAGIFDSGDDVPVDPAFDLPRVRYRVIPITVGLRTDTVSGAFGGKVALFLGLGAQTLFTRYEDPNGDHDDAPALGGLVELRPQIRLSDRWSLWVRERLTVSTNVQSRYGEINYSGAALQVGFEFNPSPGSARHEEAK